MQRRIRVLVAKPGLDGHDRGAKVVAAALRDAGMEVIYTGLHQSPEQIVEAALQEDVDVVALSVLSGAHMTLFPDVLELMRERGLGDRLLSGGGIIPPEDMETLAKMGVGRLFGPGSSTGQIGQYIREWFRKTHGEEALVAVPAGVAEEWPGEPAATARARAAFPSRRARAAAGAGARPAAARARPRAARAKPARTARTRARTGSRASGRKRR